MGKSKNILKNNVDYRYKKEISWCCITDEIYVKNERTGEAYVLKGNSRKVFLEIYNKDSKIIANEAFKSTIKKLINKGIIESAY